MARRVYVDRSHAYAPFENAVLQGLGLDAPAPAPPTDRNGWPAKRGYYEIAHFRAPYDEFGYFQDNSLQGLGVMRNSYVSVSGGRGMRGLGALAPVEVDALASQAPGAVKEYLLSGAPVSSLRSDVTLPFNQVHPYVYGGIAVAALATSYLSYKRWKKAHGQGQ